MILRPYQQAAVTAVLAEPLPVCLVAPTGAGKTAMAMEILEHTTGEALFVVHRRELLFQAMRIAATVGGEDLRLHVATIQGILAREEYPPADTLVIDECHHIAAAEWRAIPDYYQHAKVVGLTATPERADGTALGDIFKAMVTAADYPELVRDGYLVPCRVLRPERQLDRGLAQDPVEAYLAHGEGRSGFVYAPRISEAENLARRFCEAGVPALAVSSETDTDVRDDALAALAEGRVRLLVNVYCLTEGVDIPSASICVLARGVGHVSTYLQMVGRVLRPSAGKVDALLLDLPGASHEHGEPCEARVYSLDGHGIRRAADSVTTCMQCGASYESGPLACPMCSFVRPYTTWKPLRIYSMALKAAYKGAATHDEAKDAEWRRVRLLASERGYGLAWAIGQFKKLFGHAPPLHDVTDAEKRDVLARFRSEAERKGFNPKYALARYKQVFDAWPPR